mmetsp:Transcript_32875/g.73756  ORF Transcript_32875/g.73756 Transcript_32875/m.73756 type:complete len:284 (+) Transcript_32875:85-936(+)
MQTATCSVACLKLPTPSSNMAWYKTQRAKLLHKLTHHIFRLMIRSISPFQPPFLCFLPPCSLATGGETVLAAAEGSWRWGKTTWEMRCRCAGRCCRCCRHDPNLETILPRAPRTECRNGSLCGSSALKQLFRLTSPALHALSDVVERNMLTVSFFRSLRPPLKTPLKCQSQKRSWSLTPRACQAFRARRRPETPARTVDALKPPWFGQATSSVPCRQRWTSCGKRRRGSRRKCEKQSNSSVRWQSQLASILTVPLLNSCSPPSAALWTCSSCRCMSATYPCNT